jgi:hypothetical protein
MLRSLQRLKVSWLSARADFELSVWLGSVVVAGFWVTVGWADEPLQLGVFRKNTNGVVLRWSALQGRSYSVQTSGSLALNGWMDWLLPPLPKENTPMIVPIDLTEGQAFYRLADRGWAVSGVVRDKQGPVPGAVVRVQGTTNASFTDEAGRFVLAGLPEHGRFAISAWKYLNYCAKVESVSARTQDIPLTLRRYQTNDNPRYRWISPTGEGSCMSCKADLTKQWLENDAHAGAATNPRFLTMYNGTDTQGQRSPLTQYVNSLEYGRIPLAPDSNQPYYGPGYRLDFPQSAGNCAACHLPGAAVDAPYGTDPNLAMGADRFGVHCDFCHKVADVTVESSSRLPFRNRPGVMSMDVRRPFPEDPQRYQLFFGSFDDDNVPEEDTKLPLLSESRFCAACHFGVFWNVTVYNSYGEWLSSPYSRPKVGRTCQDCHMPTPSSYNGQIITNVAPGKGGIARNPGTIHAHTFPGAGSADLLRNAVSLQVSALRQNGGLDVTVSITNDKTGHHVPSDSPLRHMILLVKARDERGITLPQTDGPQVPDWGGKGEVALGNYAGHAGKAYAKVLEELWTEVSPSGAYWNPTRLVSDNRLAALATDESHYRFADPGKDSTAVEVKLLFRRAYKSLMEQKGWTVPDLVMAETNLVVPR